MSSSTAVDDSLGGRIVIILELREQAQAIRAEGGEQMHADLMMRAATALAAERKAREEGKRILLEYCGPGDEPLLNAIRKAFNE